MKIGHSGVWVVVVLGMVLYIRQIVVLFTWIYTCDKINTHTQIKFMGKIMRSTKIGSWVSGRVCWHPDLSYYAIITRDVIKGGIWVKVTWSLSVLFYPTFLFCFVFVFVVRTLGMAEKHCTVKSQLQTTIFAALIRVFQNKMFFKLCCLWYLLFTALLRNMIISIAWLDSAMCVPIDFWGPFLCGPFLTVSANFLFTFWLVYHFVAFPNCSHPKTLVFPDCTLLYSLPTPQCPWAWTFPNCEVHPFYWDFGDFQNNTSQQHAFWPVSRDSKWLF